MGGQCPQVTADGFVILLVASIRGLDLFAGVGRIRAQIAWPAIRQKYQHRRRSAARSAWFHLGLHLSLTCTAAVAIATRGGVTPNNTLPQHLEAAAKVGSEPGGVGDLGLGQEGQALVGIAVAKDPLRLVVPQDETAVDARPPLELDQVGGGGKYRVVAGHELVSVGVGSTCAALLAGAAAITVTTNRDRHISVVHRTAPIDAQVDVGEGLGGLGGFGRAAISAPNAPFGFDSLGTVVRSR